MLPLTEDKIESYIIKVWGEIQMSWRKHWKNITFSVPIEKQEMRRP